MSKRGKRGRKRGKRGGRRRTGVSPKAQQSGSWTPGWHLKLEELRRQAIDKPAMVAVKLMRGWELQLRWRPEPPEGEHQWQLIAMPACAQPHWDWLCKAADFLGIPEKDEDGEGQRPTERDGLAAVSWEWTPEVSAPAIIKKRPAQGGSSS